MSRILGSSGASDQLLPGRSHTPSYGTRDNSEQDINSAGTRAVAAGQAGSRAAAEAGQKKDRVLVVARCALTVCIASLVAGMNIGFTSPALPELQNSNLTSEHQQFNTTVLSNAFGALGAFGAMFGGLVAWPVSDHYGRQAALIVSGLPSLAGWLMIANAPLVTGSQAGFLVVLFSGRILAGFATGWSIFCASVYIAEVSSAGWKGFFGNCNQLFITLGTMIIYLLGINFAGFQFRYSYIALVAAAFVALFEILMLTTYESPRWLFKKNMDYKGIRVLKALRGARFQISEEIDDIKAGLRRTYSTKEQLFEFKNRSVYHPLILILFLMFFQQFSGINAAVFYASQVFQDAGFGTDKANLVTFGAIGVVQVLATLVSVVLVDYLGRRKLLMVSSVGMAVSSLTLGVYYYIFESKTKCNHGLTSAGCPSHIEFLAIASVIVFIISFSLGWGPIPWSSMSELLPDQVRTLGGSIATFSNWLFATIITLAFQSYANLVRPQFAWWTFAVIMVVGAVFVLLFLPEAKNRSLTEIQEYFETGQVLVGVSFCQHRKRKASSSSPNASVMRDASTYTPTSSLDIARESSSIN